MWLKSLCCGAVTSSARALLVCLLCEDHRHTVNNRVASAEMECDIQP